MKGPCICTKALFFKIAFIILFNSAGMSVFSQTVPDEMYIGDLKLEIKESARNQIQGDVDRLTSSQTYYGILVDRMNLYFPIVEEEFEKSGVPKEIMFLSIQESALISDAVSSSNAVGFWQFKDFTAREVGLRVDRLVDERLNIRAASHGATKYLNQHNFFFDNWQYSVTAYNTGRGTANKTYAKETNFGARKMVIDRNTHWYFKKFLAHVVAFAPSLGLPHSEGIWLKEVTDTKGKTLAQIAKAEKVDLEEVKKYNKWLKTVRVPDDKEYSIFVPKTGTPPKSAMASTVEKSTPKSKIEEPAVKRYPTEIAPGFSNSDHTTIIPLNGIPSVLAKQSDDVHSLSAKGGISEKRFRKYNDMGPGDKVIPNEFYYIRKKKGRSKIGFHVAQKGETLWEVSQLYGIRMSKLAKKNRMSIIDNLETGRIVWLEKRRPSSTPVAYHKTTVPEFKEPKPIVTASKEVEPEPILKPEFEKIEPEPQDTSEEIKKVKIHTVAKGESLWAISRKYDVTVKDILRWNDVSDPNEIAIGQNILVKPPIEEVSVNKDIHTHTVTTGDTLYGISRKYGMTIDEIMDLNGLSSTNISVGDTLKVFKN